MRCSRSASALVAVLATTALLAPTALGADAKDAKDGKAPKAAPAAVAIKWLSIAEGEAQAKSTGKPALYFFTAEWCSPCHILENEVLSIPEVARQVQKDFVPIRVEDRMRETGRNSDEMLALADRYGLRGFPTLVVSRPGLAKNVILEGWERREIALAFLKDGRQKFLDTEKKAR